MCRLGRWLGALGVSLCMVGGAWAGPKVQVTEDLYAAGRLAEQRDLPMLVVFSAEHCTYCELLDREILEPMLLSGDYTDKVLIRKIELDGHGEIRDFSGDPVDASRFATRNRVYVTPTLLFLDHRGEELAPRIIGINTLDFYGGEVDAAIDRSLQRLQGRSGLAEAAPHASAP